MVENIYNMHKVSHTSYVKVKTDSGDKGHSVMIKEPLY